MRAGSRISEKTRQRVLERDEHSCVRCGMSIEGSQYSIHHRKLRSHGVDNSLSNLVTLCGSGTTGCHGWVHSHPGEAHTAGFIVSATETPANIMIERSIRQEDGTTRHTVCLLEANGGIIAPLERKGLI